MGSQMAIDGPVDRVRSEWIKKMSKIKSFVATCCGNRTKNIKQDKFIVSWT